MATDLPSLSFQDVYVQARGDVFELSHPAPLLVNSFMAELKPAMAKAKARLESAKTHEEMLQAVGSPEFATVRHWAGMLKAPWAYDQVCFELENQLYNQVVIYGIHRDVLHTLHELFKAKGFRVELVYGGTAPDKRDAAVNRFQEGRSQIFLGNIAAAGTAINLTAAHNGILLERDPVPGNNLQACMRMHRFGQEHPVVIRRVTLEDSIDERINEIVDRKTDELSQLFL